MTETTATTIPLPTRLPIVHGPDFYLYDCPLPEGEKATVDDIPVGVETGPMNSVCKTLAGIALNDTVDETIFFCPLADGSQAKITVSGGIQSSSQETVCTVVAGMSEAAASSKEAEKPFLSEPGVAPAAGILAAALMIWAARNARSHSNRRLTR